jgi:hypothetical protein
MADQKRNNPPELDDFKAFVASLKLSSEEETLLYRLVPVLGSFACSLTVSAHHRLAAVDRTRTQADFNRCLLAAATKVQVCAGLQVDREGKRGT